MPPPTRSASTKEADQALFNKRLLKNADDRRIVKSWLKAWSTEPTNSTPLNTSHEENIEEQNDEDEDEDFSAESDTGGLGFVKPTNSSPISLSDRQNLRANDNLRRQMLGNKANLREFHRVNSQGQIGSTPRPQPKRTKRQTNSDTDDDENEARTKAIVSRLGSTKHDGQARAGRPETKGQSRTAPSKDGGGDDQETNSGRGSGSGIIHASQTTTTTTITTTNAAKIGKKRAVSSYLDEMLAKRGSKAQKRARKSVHGDDRRYS